MEKMGAGSDPGAAGWLCRDSILSLNSSRSASISDKLGDIEVRSPAPPCKHQGLHLCAQLAELLAALQEKGAHLHPSFLEHFNIPLFSILLQHGINLFVRAVCPGEGWSQTALKAGAQSLHPTENPISQGPGENFHPSSASHSCSPLCSVTATPLPHLAVQSCN